MVPWSWESFEELINSGRFEISDHGPLHAPILNFSLERDDDLKLILTTHAAHDAQATNAKQQLGTVRLIEEKVAFRRSDGVILTAEGVMPTSYAVSYGTESGYPQAKETIRIHRLCGVLSPDATSSWTIDWLANLPSGWIWPDFTNYINETKWERRLYSSTGHECLLKSRATENQYTRNCAHLSVGDYEIYLTTLEPDAAAKVNYPGCLIYKGTPSDDIRTAIRECLGLAMGIFLVYLGCSSFTEEWKITKFEAVSAYSLDGRAFSLPPLPPSSLSSYGVNAVDGNVLSRVSNALFSHYEVLAIPQLAWAYWHAACADIYMAPAQYGALIEKLENLYIKHAGLNTRLIEDRHWQQLREALLSLVDQEELSETDRPILKNKISGLNVRSRPQISKAVYEKLGLQISNIEQRVWSRRNDAAHGGSLKSNDTIKLIRDIKVLKTRFHRTLLAITQASDTYTDYYSLGCPQRQLADPISDQD